MSGDGCRTFEQYSTLKAVAEDNISRCSLKDWWAEFLGSVDAQRVFSRVVAEHNVNELAQWIIDQVAPALALTFKAFHGTWFRTNVLEAGEKRWSKRYLALWEDFQDKSKFLDNQLYKMNVLYN